MTSEPDRAPLPCPEGYLRGLRLRVHTGRGREVIEWDAAEQYAIDAAAVAAVLQAAWPQRRTVGAAELEVWNGLSGLRP